MSSSVPPPPSEMIPTPAPVHASIPAIATPPPPTAASAPANRQTSNASYRILGLDGLRAIGCAAVLLYHLLPEAAPGGFLGVDVFFVLSGFLITALLVRDYEKLGKVRITRFWLRRIRRLFPAVATTAFSCTIIALFVSRDLLLGIKGQLAGVLTFTYNWLKLFKGENYFNLSNPDLFTNMWSLAVEQQFYLFWPLVVVLLVLFPRPLKVLAALLLATASTALMGLIAPDNLNRAYLGSDTHAFGLMIGAALAFTIQSPLASASTPAKGAQVRGLGGTVGLIALLICFYLAPDQGKYTYPWLTLLVCLAAALVIQAVLAPVIIKKTAVSPLVFILDSKPFVWLGERSYSIYLWHWPILVISRAAAPLLNPLINALIVTALSVLLAAVTYRWIENPMRQDGILHTLKGWLYPIGKRPFARAVRWVAVFTIISAVIASVVLAPAKTSAQEAVERGEAAKAPASKAPSKPPDNSPAPTPRGLPIQPVGANVTFLGDSVMLAAKGEIQAAFPGALVDAEVSRAWPTAISLINQYKESGQLGYWVVLSLATNTDLRPEQIDPVRQALGPDHHLVLVTGFGPTSEPWIYRTNDALIVYAATHPKDTLIVRWDQVAPTIREHLASDSVHPDQEGAKRWVTELVQTLKDYPGVTQVGAS
ncbi:acyltransferase family protein [uncultured Varibaculum sp.]|uniref:acyltransferase family protein n=1 Tax=uncultured Varibaculum sp. TaxID=413896 RepID=UPI002594283B|nr:acyltransferase family protein [uncultured Varibaculum sp.]